MARNRSPDESGIGNRVRRSDTAMVPATPRDRAVIWLPRLLTNRPRPQTELNGWNVAQDS